MKDLWKSEIWVAKGPALLVGSERRGCYRILTASVECAQTSSPESSHHTSSAAAGVNR
jgi:hypothetical protein